MSSGFGSLRRASRQWRCLLFVTGLFLCALPASANVAEPAPAAEPARQAVVLLHGLARGSASWGPMSRALEEAGYEVCNIAYPSREYGVEVLATEHVAPAIAACFPQPGREIDVVTHSMGGLVVRQLATATPGWSIRRVVMLAPPNHGSEAADTLMDNWFYREIGGPAALELGTAPEALPQRLGAARFDLGIITGDRSMNPIISLVMIPGPDDGKVSTASARVDGMRDMLVLHTTHVFIMRNTQVIRQTLHFLERGEFDHTQQS